ncbi:phospholipase D-like domain-containing protein [Sphingomonas sp. Tas61C01]|uniref:phospholipase D-like domain-containing protein n=1 Tax=Sphingomonas sp. Tas61C01 TaxID=3458297 RepID=UPI00403E8190
MLRIDQNCRAVARADKLTVIVDAARYFAVARQALIEAQQRIMLIGWDFDARIVLDADATEGPAKVGEFLLWLVDRNPALNLYLLRWDLGAIKSLFRGTTLFSLLKLMRHPRIHVRLDGHHPTGASHHQKIVCIDDCLAFCGGIDMTDERWDTCDHRDHDPRRLSASGKPHKPWHDATTAVSGPAASALAEICRERWLLGTGETLAPVEARRNCWPAALEPMFENIEIGIAQTRPEMPTEIGLLQIEALFLDQIASARRHVYCESQYFASRRIAEAIARRLDEPDGPEFVIVNPVTAQGWLEPLAMDTARARLMEALKRRDKHGRLRMYHPYTAGGTPIYVHAKLTFVDDRQLRVGSANMNNRSLRLDTECDLIVVADDEATAATILDVRNRLLGEHLGVAPGIVAATIAEEGSLIGAVERLRGDGRSLRPYEPKDLASIEKWLADNEVLDPEGPEEMFEGLSKRGLFRGRLKRHRKD